MRNSLQRHAIILAALLQVLPLIRNFFLNPATTSSFAFILRWGVGTAATVGAYDACSGATNSFALPTNILGTISAPFATNLTLTAKTSGDGGALCTILTNGTVAAVLSNLQTTTNGMPAGLALKFFDLNTGNSSFTNVYCAITGTPTKTGTNLFHVDLFYAAGNQSVPGDFRIAIQAASGGSAPAITNQPVSLTNLVTSNATFSVTAGGTAPLAYQWFYNTNTALLNATNATLTLTNLQLTNAGYYLVRITNSAGTTNSASALLTVWQPPVFTNQPVNFTALVTSNATFSVTAGGFPAPAYQWFYNTNTALPNATGTSLTLTNVQFTNAGYYLVRITNAAGTLNSASALLTVWQPPIITNQPVNFTNVAGGSASFNVTAGGVPPVNYQWQLNPGTPQAGATSATFNLANLRANQAGNYSVVITNAAGSITSSPAALVVTNPLPTVAVSPAINAGKFSFTFNGIPGLTNTVQTNGDLSGNNWGVFTNLPPPANNNPITISNPAGLPNLFYRVQVVP